MAEPADSSYRDLIIQGLEKHNRVRTLFSGNSMLPTLKEGMRLDIEKESPDEIRRGDIIVYKKSDAMVVHRAVKITRDGHKRIFVTRGDNHAYIEPDRIQEDDLIGVVRAAYSMDDPEKDVLIKNRFMDILYAGSADLLVFVRRARNHVPRPVRNIFKYFVGGFFSALKKFTHLMHSILNHGNGITS
jgi:signal peptidase